MKPRKLKFGFTMRINKSVMSANFGDPRSYNHELRHKKTQKNGNFWLVKLLIWL